MLRNARDNVKQAVQVAELLAAQGIGERAHDRTQQHRGAKASDKELTNLTIGESIARVESIDVRALQPVGTDGEEVDNQVAAMEHCHRVALEQVQRAGGTIPRSTPSQEHNDAGHKAKTIKR